MPKKKTLEQKIKDQLYEMICMGGGNAETLQGYASHIETLARQHIASEVRNG